MTDRVYPVRTIASMLEVNIDAMAQSAFDLRDIAHENLTRLLEQHRVGRWVSEIEFDEQKTERLIPTYPEGADPDDPDLEPVDWEAIPVLMIRAKRRCLDET